MSRRDQQFYDLTNAKFKKSIVLLNSMFISQTK
jgi:hypothetical protein